jgi:ubiquinone/menaquinone biosynthesis C-methylase UbiE
MSNQIFDIEKYWSTHVFGEGVHFQEEPFFNDLIKKCSIEGCKVLDIGVGNGRMPRNIQKHCNPRITGIDITDQMLNAPVDEKIKGDVRELPFDDSMFDVVYSLGVVEHFPETEKALSEHVRVLKPGGTLYFTTPHLSIATLLKVYQFYKGGHYKDNTFEAVRGRNLTINYISEIMKKLPVKIIKLEGCGVREGSSLLKKIFKSIIPNSFQNPHLYCIAEKNE